MSNSEHLKTEENEKIPTKVLSFRVPLEDYKEFKKMKAEQAHSLVPDTALFVEAFRLYVRLANRYGLTSSLQVRDDSGSGAKKPPIRANDRHPR